MNISEKANAYAKGKVMKPLKSAIEKAYADGYNAGFADGLAKKEEEKKNFPYNDVEYIDLGLPSGTKWASCYLQDKTNHDVNLPYDEAAKLNIPTNEQFLELVKCCRREDIFNELYGPIGVRFVGVNGNCVNYFSVERKIDKRGKITQYPIFWLKNSKKGGDTLSLDRLIASEGMNVGFAYKDSLYPVVLVR